MWADALASKKKLLIFVGIFLSIMVIGVLLIGNTGKKDPGEKNEYYDPGSGETVSNPPNKSSENASSTKVAVTYLGFSRLLESGLNNDQVEEIKFLIETYSSNSNADFKELSIARDSIGTTIPEVGSGAVDTVVVAKMTANRGKVYDLTMSYSSILKIKLVISLDGKELYNSGEVDTFLPVGEEDD